MRGWPPAAQAAGRSKRTFCAEAVYAEPAQGLKSEGDRQTHVVTSFAGNFTSQKVRLPPFCISIRDHHMEAPGVALFRGFHQAQVAQVLEIRFNPRMLILVQSAPG